MAKFGFVERKVHKALVKPGDVIRHNGHEMTVGRSDIKTDGFMGKTIFGDSYKLGYEMVTLLEYKQLET